MGKRLQRFAPYLRPLLQIKLWVIHRKRLQRFAVATQEVRAAFFHAFALGNHFSTTIYLNQDLQDAIVLRYTSETWLRDMACRASTT
jgi:hypothetical protein